MAREEEKAEAPKEKKQEKKGKKIRKGRKHENQKVYRFYKVAGANVARLKKHCPRCGPGTWLGTHKNRVVCGKCGYAESEKKES